MMQPIRSLEARGVPYISEGLLIIFQELLKISLLMEEDMSGVHTFFDIVAGIFRESDHALVGAEITIGSVRREMDHQPGILFLIKDTSMRTSNSSSDAHIKPPLSTEDYITDLTLIYQTILDLIEKIAELLVMDIGGSLIVELIQS
jgi:hypothetical protein